MSASSSLRTSLTLIALAMLAAGLAGGDRTHGGKHQIHSGHSGLHTIHDDAVMVNEDHIKLHLAKDYGIKKDTREMSKSELEFYEFKAHDFDENSKLDGLEMLKAMTHYDLVDVNFLTDEERRTLTPKEVVEKRHNLIAEKYASMEKEVDYLMVEHDLDKDGYLSYPEYLIARWKKDE